MGLSANENDCCFGLGGERGSLEQITKTPLKTKETLRTLSKAENKPAPNLIMLFFVWRVATQIPSEKVENK